MFRTLSRSWEMVKASWQVLKSDRELLVFPLLSTIGIIIITILVAIPIFASGLADSLASSSQARGVSGGEIIGVIIAFLFYFVTYTVIIFSNVALVGAAMIRLDGGDPTVSDGFRVASERIGPILGYAAISATVGMILRAIQNSDNLLAKIAAGIVGIAWGMATYMVVPVLVVENLGPIEAVKRSTGLLKETWGEQIAGEFSIGGIIFLVSLGVIIVIGVPLILISPIIGIIAVVLIIAVISLVGSALSSIYQAAVYQYAAEGKVSDYFDEAMITGAFKPKRKRGE